MKEEKDIFEQFRGKDQTSSVRPSKQAWEKLSSRLDDYQKPQVKQLPLYRRFKTWSIAGRRFNGSGHGSNNNSNE